MTNPIPASWTSKLDTLVWYLQRPALYRELLRRAVSLGVTTPSSRLRAEEERRDGVRWCGQTAAPLADVLAALQLDPSITPVAQLYPDEWAAAEAAVAASPGVMGGPAHVDLLHHVVRGMQPTLVLETGVAAGWSSLAILLALPPSGRLISVDMPYAKRGNEDFVGCAVPQALRSAWKLVRRPDRDGLPPIVRRAPALDIVHYDSDKSFDGRMFAYDLVWPKLRDGGVLISDDVEDNLAFAIFAARVGRKAWVTAKAKPGNYAGFIIK